MKLGKLIKRLQKTFICTLAMIVVFTLASNAMAVPITIVGNATQLWNKSIFGNNGGNLLDDLNSDSRADAVLTNCYVSSCTATAVRGYDGVELWNKTASYTGTSSWMWAADAGDLNGDGKPDVLLITNSFDSATSTYTTIIDAVRGYDGTEIWSKTITGASGGGAWGDAAGDVNGNGIADVVININSRDPITSIYTYTLSVVRGNDGIEMWNRSYSGSIGGLWGNAAGDVNGDNKDEVVINTYRWDSLLGTYIYETIVARGYDGVELWKRSYSISSGSVNGMPAGDVNGDGWDDITTTLCYIGTSCTISTVRGYDGAEMWNRTFSTSSGGLNVMPTGDLNGDNKADIILIPNPPSSSYTTVTALRGYDGLEIWSKYIPFSGGGGNVWGGSAGDINNDLRKDVLLNINDFSSTYKISIVNGMDGLELFRVEASTSLSSAVPFHSPEVLGKKYDMNGDGGSDIIVWTSDAIYAIYSTALSFAGSGSSVGYSATVATGQNTFVQSSNGSFGLLLKGETKTINNSVILNNTGDLSAKVEARFNDSIGGVFGLVSGANVLNATNFALGLPGILMPLSSLGADVQVAVAPPGMTTLDARLAVPSDAVAGDYSGTVVLTFSNNV